MSRPEDRAPHPHKAAMVIADSEKADLKTEARNFGDPYVDLLLDNIRSLIIPCVVSVTRSGTTVAWALAVNQTDDDFATSAQFKQAMVPIFGGDFVAGPLFSPAHQGAPDLDGYLLGLSPSLYRKENPPPP